MVLRVFVPVMGLRMMSTKVVLGTFLTMDNNGRITELVESFPSAFSPESELVEEFIHHLCTFVLVNPYCKGGMGGIVVSRFTHGAKSPVDLEGSIPSVRDLLSLCTSCRGRSYCQRGHLVIRNTSRAHPLVREWASHFCQ